MSASPPVTLQQDVYRRILQFLLSGRWHPGHKLSEQVLARQLGVNRNPVREALLRLAGEGLVVRQINAGCRVAHVDVTSLIELYQLREAIEGMGAKLAAPRITPLQLHHLTCAHERMAGLKYPRQLAAYAESDGRFHHLLVSASGNRLLIRSWEQQQVQILFAKSLLLPVEQVPRNRFQVANRAHARILKALRTHDSAEAEAAVREHIANALLPLLRLACDARSEVGESASIPAGPSLFVCAGDV